MDQRKWLTKLYFRIKLIKPKIILVAL